MFNSFGSFCNGFSNYGRTPIGGYIMMGIGLILVVVLIYFVVKNSSNTKKIDSESALDLLKRKYVNGELDESEYLKKKEVLGSK